jgi:hypothetical protein
LYPLTDTNYCISAQFHHVSFTHITDAKTENMAVTVELDPTLLKQAAGKTVIVTGGANGIGAATAILFNANGANVVIADLEPCRGAATALIDSLASPSKAAFMPMNILDWEQGKRVFKSVVERFGGVDVVIANAAIMETSPVLDIEKVDANGEPHQPLEAYKVIDINIKGTLNSEYIPRLDPLTSSLKPRQHLNSRCTTCDQQAAL